MSSSRLGKVVNFEEVYWDPQRFWGQKHSDLALLAGDDFDEYVIKDYISQLGRIMDTIEVESQTFLHDCIATFCWWKIHRAGDIVA